MNTISLLTALGLAAGVFVSDAAACEPVLASRAAACSNRVAAPAGAPHRDPADSSGTPGGDVDYAVVVSSQTAADPQWAKVVEALQRKHHAAVIAYSGGPQQWLAPLRAVGPKYACFVARPDELGLELLLAIVRQTRQLDDGPYMGVVWGIVTGSSAENALRLADVQAPLVIRRGLGGDAMSLDPFDEGVWFYEGANALARQKKADGVTSPLACTLDNAPQFAQLLDDFAPDYIQTSGHASTRRWEVGYGCNRGHFSARDGVLYGIDVAGKEMAVHSPNPKVYLPYRNCLVGLVKDKQSLALGWLGSAGVRQMAGYIVTTWNGAAGNGTRKWLFNTPGEYSFCEAYFFNQQVMIGGMSPRARACMPTSQQYEQGGLRSIAKMLKGDDPSKTGEEELAAVWDRDTFVFYGDPAWDARLKPVADLPRWSVRTEGDIYSIEVQVQKAGGVGKYLLLPHHVRVVQWLKGQDSVKLMTGLFLHVEATVPPGSTEVVRFRGQRAALASAGRPGSEDVTRSHASRD